MSKVKKAKLASCGFQEAGRWFISTNVKSGLGFQLKLYPAEKVVYAFEVQDEVKYIGIRREQDFKTRLKAYQYQGAQEKGGSTNKYVATKIKEHLQAGQAVNILALMPSNDLKFHDLHIDLIAGLEKPLISLCDPDWRSPNERVQSLSVKRFDALRMTRYVHSRNR
ncbi:MAG: hypothetical protein J7L92_05970 [Dehalococcoidia bacterium]|nr:hypothetical protein [Dehalococcoidia bacterium]